MIELCDWTKPVVYISSVWLSPNRRTMVIYISNTNNYIYIYIYLHLQTLLTPSIIPTTNSKSISLSQSLNQCGTLRSNHFFRTPTTMMNNKFTPLETAHSSSTPTTSLRSPESAPSSTNSSSNQGSSGF